MIPEFHQVIDSIKTQPDLMIQILEKQKQIDDIMQKIYKKSRMSKPKYTAVQKEEKVILHIYRKENNITLKRSVKFNRFLQNFEILQQKNMESHMNKLIEDKKVIQSITDRTHVHKGRSTSCARYLNLQFFQKTQSDQFIKFKPLQQKQIVQSLSQKLMNVFNDHSQIKSRESNRSINRFIFNPDKYEKYFFQHYFLFQKSSQYRFSNKYKKFSLVLKTQKFRYKKNK